jgi:hypothetical protein
MKYYSSSAGDDWGYSDNRLYVSITGSSNSISDTIYMNTAIGLSPSMGDSDEGYSNMYYEDIRKVKVNGTLIVYKSK